MFIGEAPGADEDRQGEPFVGRAGQLLTKIIAAMGFTRDDVYIANVLKCRPDMPAGEPGNRRPTPEEMETCLPYLTEQIEIIRPKVLVALGATAVEGLLKIREPVGKIARPLAFLPRNAAYDHLPPVVFAAKPEQHREAQGVGGHAAGPRASRTPDLRKAAQIFSLGDPRRCHPERNAVESKNPVLLPATAAAERRAPETRGPVSLPDRGVRVIQRNPSTSLGMTAFNARSRGCTESRP